MATASGRYFAIHEKVLQLCGCQKTKGTESIARLPVTNSYDRAHAVRIEMLDAALRGGNLIAILDPPPDRAATKLKSSSTPGEVDVASPVAMIQHRQGDVDYSAV